MKYIIATTFCLLLLAGSSQYLGEIELSGTMSSQAVFVDSSHNEVLRIDDDGTISIYDSLGAIMVLLKEQSRKLKEVKELKWQLDSVITECRTSAKYISQ